MPYKSISVIIPAHNAAETLPQTLTALTTAEPAPNEIIVVDDSSSDMTNQVAKEFGVRVMQIEHLGAAAAKNRGAQAATGDLLLFTDSDIVTPSNVVAILQAAFEKTNCDGVIGLLDENIPAQNWASQFKNLWMNFTYTRFANAQSIGLFYTSIAAIRRDTFLKLGGFDENFRGASIAEDTEFGQRAWGKGVRIILEPNLRVVHLKTYTSAGVLREDFRRARALTQMRLRKWGEPFFTSVPFFYQLAVPFIYLTCGFLLAAFILTNAMLLLTALIGLALFYLLNSSLLRFLFQKRGVVFALQSALFLPADVLVVGLGILKATIDFARGTRY